MVSRLLVALAAAAFAFGCGGAEEAGAPSGPSLASQNQRAQASAQRGDSGANRPPRVDSVRLTPSSPISGAPLEAIVESSDPDGDLLRHSYEWRVNGETLESGPKAVVQLAKLAKGDRVEVSVVASDGRLESAPKRTSARVANRTPTLLSFFVTPTNKRIRRGDVLTAAVETTDPDKDRVELSYRWFVNGAEAGAERTFDTRHLHEGDRVVVEVVASDGDAETQPQRAPEIVLANSPPVIRVLPALEGQGDVLQYQFEAEDPEGDRNLRFYLASAPEGMDIDPVSGLLTWQPSASQGGKHTVKVGVKDSEGDGTEVDWEVTVTPTGPPAAQQE